MGVVWEKGEGKGGGGDGRLDFLVFRWERFRVEFRIGFWIGLGIGELGKLIDCYEVL